MNGIGHFSDSNIVICTSDDKFSDTVEVGQLNCVVLTLDFLSLELVRNVAQEISEMGAQ